MNFSITEVDQVIARTGCSYQEAKDALVKADGDVVDAIILLESRRSVFGDSRFKGFAEETERTADTVVTRIKEIIEEGNASRFKIRDNYGKDIVSSRSMSALRYRRFITGFVLHGNRYSGNRFHEYRFHHGYKSGADRRSCTAGADLIPCRKIRNELSLCDRKERRIRDRSLINRTAVKSGTQLYALRAAAVFDMLE